MTKVMGMKKVNRCMLDGYARETYEIELDGLPSVEVEVKVPKSVDRIVDPSKRADKMQPHVMKAAQPHISALVADHAG